MTMIRDLDLVGDDFSIEDARLVFSWSRMRAIDGEGWPKLSNLSFLDFCEALLRVCCIKALPTTADIRGAGCSSAHEFMEKLRSDDHSKLREFVEKRRGRRVNELGACEPPAHQPVYVALTHLLNLIFCESMRQDEDASRSRNRAAASVISTIVSKHIFLRMYDYSMIMV